MSEIPDMISTVVGDNKIDAESHFKNVNGTKNRKFIGLKTSRSSEFFGKKATRNLYRGFC